LINFLPPFLLGFLALSFQIYLLREFSVHFYGNEITFGFILAAWLLWGGIGSISSSKLKFNSSRLPQNYYLIILLFPLCLAGLRFSRFSLKILPGEVTGIIPILVSSLVLSLFISFPLGALFVFNVFFQKGNLFRVYLLESLGSATAGLVVYLILIPLFSNWQGAAICGAAVSLSIFFYIGKRKKKVLLFFILLFLVSFSFFDFPGQKVYWQPFHLVRSKDTLYGKLQVLQTEEQISLYSNSLLIYSYPDLAAAEESVHFALLQNPEAKNVLLIGGGAGGALQQVLKYPQAQVDYVELDPDIIRLSLQFLPEVERNILSNERVHIFYRDGRAFLSKAEKKYDVIILNLPEPATAQINRFYTKEFFILAKERLKAKGIFSFRVPSAENYISPELQNFLASLYYTLKEAFPFVEVVPGNTNIFLASFQPLSIEFDKLSKEIENLNLQNSFVSPQLLFARLSPLRLDLIRQKISSAKKTINQDFSPIGYFFNSVLWSTKFKGIERRIFSFFSRLSSFWLLDFPLLLFLLLLLILWLRRKRTNIFLVPLAVMGFTTIIVEIIAIISFQTLYGYLYRKIALLLASFMVGLFLGALHGMRRKKIGLGQLLLIQFGFLVLLLLLSPLLNVHPPEWPFFILLLAFGYLGGNLFVISNCLFLEEKKNFGLGYGLDLLGSFLGALAASSFLIPLIGLIPLLRYLFLLNSFCLLFLFTGTRRR